MKLVPSLRNSRLIKAWAYFSADLTPKFIWDVTTTVHLWLLFPCYDASMRLLPRPYRATATIWNGGSQSLWIYPWWPFTIGTTCPFCTTPHWHHCVNCRRTSYVLKALRIMILIRDYVISTDTWEIRACRRRSLDWSLWRRRAHTRESAFWSGFVRR